MDRRDSWLWCKLVLHSTERAWHTAHRRGAHGEQLKGKRFEGLLAIKLGQHGVAISWDGCVIRHCTSISQPDGLCGEKVGFDRKTFSNKLYGTFTAAKEKVVKAGRAWCRANKLDAVDAVKEVGDKTFDGVDCKIEKGSLDGGGDNGASVDEHDPAPDAKAEEVRPLLQQVDIENYRIPKMRHVW